MSERLEKIEKLKSKKLIDSLFISGKSVSKYPIRLIYKEITNNDLESQLQITVSVSKRNFKKAVDRNYLKRLLREVYRKNKYLVSDHTNRQFIFMFLYVGKDIFEYSELDVKMKKLLKKFIEQEIETLL